MKEIDQKREMLLEVKRTLTSGRVLNTRVKMWLYTLINYLKDDIEYLKEELNNDR